MKVILLMMRKKILITGASGFIGSTIVDKAVELGFETWAGIRKSSNKRYLQHDEIQFVNFDYADKAVLKSQLEEFAKIHGKFDYIVHAAGLTKVINLSDFDDVNFIQTRNFVDALRETNHIPEIFIFMSTLGVMGPGDEIGYLPILQDLEPNPNTAYGKSKLKAENYIRAISDFPYVFLRPTGVYGPRDKDYLILIRGIKKGFEVGAGFRKQLLSFIYIDDLVKIVFDVIQKGISRRAYNVSDGACYTDAEFNQIVKNVLRRKRTLKIKLPLSIVRIAAKINSRIARMLGKATTFNNDKYYIMKQRNWNCDISSLKEELDFKADYSLQRGIEKTVAWYMREGWL